MCVTVPGIFTCGYATSQISRVETRLRMRSIMGPGEAPQPRSKPAGLRGASPRTLQETQQNEEMQEALRQQAEERKRVMLRALLTPEAQERLHRVQLVKEENARAVEAILLQNAQQGRLTGKVDEEALIELLQQVGASGVAKASPKVTIRRRRMENDDDF